MFSQAREKARGAACLSNLKQIGLAYTQYEQDYDEFVPCGLNATGQGIGWAGMIYPYVKSANLYLCPDDVNPADVVSYAVNSNMVDHRQVGSTYYPAPTAISIMIAPSKTVMLFEVINSSGYTVTADNQKSPAGYGNNLSASNTLNGANSGTSSTSLKYATGLLYNASATADGASYAASSITTTNSYFLPGGLGDHQYGANYLMADCHAKWFPPSLVGAGFDIPVAHPSDSTHDATCPPVSGWSAPTVTCTTPISPAATFALH
ncbi:MAG: DUF1559 domain-containing protein [Capsulimonadaceae bacterium]|nr:DUF1559 domain-containing protein [Capsulimonadaceae bacterium]